MGLVRKPAFLLHEQKQQQLYRLTLEGSSCKQSTAPSSTSLQALPPQAEAADPIANLPSDRPFESKTAASVPGLSFAPLHGSKSFSALLDTLVPPCPELKRGPWGDQTSPSMLPSLLGCIPVQFTVPAQKGCPFFSLAGKAN